MANSKIRQSARGAECQVRYPAYCNRDESTVIFAHKGGAGMGRKNSDLFGAHCCSSCHDVADGRVKSVFTQMEIEVYFYDGIFRTQQILLDNGLIKI